MDQLEVTWPLELVPGDGLYDADGQHVAPEANGVIDFGGLALRLTQPEPSAT